jgi:cytochrome P450
MTMTEEIASICAIASTGELPRLPFHQPPGVGVAPLLRVLQAEGPVARVRTPAGDEAWLVTRYEEVRQLLGDSRLGLSHPDPQSAPRISDSALFGSAQGNFATEEADHAGMRALLVPYFSPRRMQAFRPRVEALVDELLDGLAGRRPPVDLHEALSLPVPVLVICELLGVPYEDRSQFRAWSQDMAGTTDREQSGQALGNLVGYMHELVARKRACPGDDVLSGLVGAGLADGDIAYLGALLLFAGQETTVVRLDLGTLLMCINPGQRQLIQRRPGLLPCAVEEILRATGAGGGWVPRWARSDLTIGGVTVRAGEAVLLHIASANYDEDAFAEPDRFDVTRTPNLHLAFGQGPRYCIGAPLARIELQAVFARLIPRFPGMRLAAPLDQLQVRTGLLTGGLAQLPVTW